MKEGIERMFDEDIGNSLKDLTDGELDDLVDKIIGN